MADEVPDERRLPYGPMTAVVRRFLVQLASLDERAHDAVVTRFAEVCARTDYVAADRVLGAILEQSGRSDARDAVAGPLLLLVRLAAEDAPAAEASALDPIAEPALAVLLALIVSDLLSHDTLHTLYEPFRIVRPLAAVLSA